MQGSGVGVLDKCTELMRCLFGRQHEGEPHGFRTSLRQAGGHIRWLLSCREEEGALGSPERLPAVVGCACDRRLSAA